MFDVLDTLESDSTIDALSANQGKILNGKITETNNSVSDLEDRVTTLEENSSGSSNCGCETKIWTQPVA